VLQKRSKNECQKIDLFSSEFQNLQTCVLTFCSFSVADGEAIKLPENLESLPKAEHFPTQRHRWNTNEVSVFLKDDTVVFIS
jgi:hypothetical protein